MSGKLSEAELSVFEGIAAYRCEGSHSCPVDCGHVTSLMGHIAALQSERDELLRACVSLIEGWKFAAYTADRKWTKRSDDAKRIPDYMLDQLNQCKDSLPEEIKSAIFSAQVEKGKEPLPAIARAQGEKGEG